MKLGFIGRTLDKVRNAVHKLTGHNTNLVRHSAEVSDSGKLKKKAPTLARLIRVRLSGDKGIFGPAFIPDKAGHHLSRQTCRARLRGLMFQNISNGIAAKKLAPMSRRDRRKWASIYARLEYRRMMADDTNAIPDDERRLLERLARLSQSA